MTKKNVVITIDLEEFDLPLEYGMEVSMQEQIDISTRGMLALKTLFEKHGIPITIFCTGQYALQQPKLVKELSLTHEIASHTMFHGSFDAGKDLLQSKNVLAEITNQNILGLRMPRMSDVESRYLLEAGYRYNASLNPTFIPGRYNHFRASKTPFTQDGILQIPATVTPVFRIPLFWLSFKTFPLSLYKKLTLNSLSYFDTINLYFHPWEFTELSAYTKVPAYIRKKSGPKLLLKLENYICWLKNQHTEFLTMESAYLSSALK